MIWASFNSWSCFCWLYRASPCLAAKNIINLISILTIWWCPCVESSLVLLEEGVCYEQCIVGQNSIGLCPTSFCIPRPNLPLTPGISSYFCIPIPIMKRISFLCVLECLVGLHGTVQLQLLQHYWSGHRLGLLWYLMTCLGNKQIHSVVFEIVSKNCISDCFVDCDGYSISSKGFLPTVVDVMVIWVKFTHSSPFKFSDS